MTPRKLISHRVCPKCGTAFDVLPNSRRKYCNPGCAAKAERDYALEWKKRRAEMHPTHKNGKRLASRDWPDRRAAIIAKYGAKNHGTHGTIGHKSYRARKVM